MNKKQKIVSTTLSTVTALSSVGAISSLPNTVIKNVQALNENTVETTQQVQPTVRTDLEKEVEDKNSTVISTGAALQGAENQKKHLTMRKPTRKKMMKSLLLHKIRLIRLLRKK
ncbi:MAG: hypothetical protein EGQ25_08170 [Catenibacterium mitsuokai]|nr:hypothetical protein [Catenibacterium mitsuokai]